MTQNIRIGVVGLGYVGLPVALAFSKKFFHTVGYDKNAAKIEHLKAGIDETLEVTKEELVNANLKWSSNWEDLKGVNFFVVCVPTPVDQDHRPDLSALESATKTIGQALTKNSIVVYESTVYPGVTEEICGPILEEVSGLKRGRDFFLGYSPERINPGDKEHTIDKITKVVAGENREVLKTIAQAYGAITNGGVFEAASIKVAEAAKVIENTQRDLNIALMNELAIIFDLMNICTKDVLAAAGTKWNFLKFTPGLVGGHCIGVDPYYLTAKAEQLGYHPEVILAGRRINDSVGKYVANRAVKIATNCGILVKTMKVGVLGLTFKENVPDIRNSRVPDIVSELRDFGAEVIIHDSLANADEVKEEYGLALTQLNEFKELDVLIVAVAHKSYSAMSTDQFVAMLKPKGVLIDIKSLVSRSELKGDITYWSL